jgi:ribosomal protein S18 acetylase RimI-like enzyme
LAWLAGRAVGVAVCFTGFSTFTAKPLVNIHDLAVTSGCQGRGVGRRLLEAVEAKALSFGCGKLTLEVREDNTGAQRLYRRLGFGNGGGGSATFFLSKRLG